MWEGSPGSTPHGPVQPGRPALTAPAASALAPMLTAPGRRFLPRGHLSFPASTQGPVRLGAVASLVDDAFRLPSLPEDTTTRMGDRHASPHGTAARSVLILLRLSGGFRSA